MAFDINKILSDMMSAAFGAAEKDIGEIPEYLKTVFENEKEALRDLTEARLTKQISEKEFLHELEREKVILETELLTASIMTKAIAQKAINAAMDVLKSAVKAII